MFDDPTANTNPGQSLLQGYQVGSEHAARNAQLQKYQQELAQKQAMMALGMKAAQTGDPSLIAQYSALDPTGGAGIRDSAKFFAQQGLGDLQSIKEAKITDRPAIYKMKIAALKKQNPYFDASQYADEYSPEMDKLIDADLIAGKDLERAYSLQETDRGLVKFESKTGQIAPTDYSVYKKPPSTLINIDQRQESEYNKAVGKGEGEAVVKKLDEIRNAGDQAIATKDFLQVQKDALSKLKSTGGFTGIQSFFGNLASQIVNEDERTSLSKVIANARNIDEVTAAGRKIAIPLAKQLGYNPTDADFKAILATIADVGKGKKTNQDLINMWEELSDKAIAKAQLSDDITSNNRHKSAYKELRDFDLNWATKKKGDREKRQKAAQEAKSPTQVDHPPEVKQQALDILRQRGVIK